MTAAAIPRSTIRGFFLPADRLVSRLAVDLDVLQDQVLDLEGDGLIRVDLVAHCGVEDDVQAREVADEREDVLELRVLEGEVDLHRVELAVDREDVGVGLKLDTTRKYLQRARVEKLLKDASPGKPGGVLADEAIEMLQEARVLLDEALLSDRVRASRRRRKAESQSESQGPGSGE